MKSDEFILSFGHQMIYEGLYNYGIKLVQDIVIRGDGTSMITKLVDLTKVLSYYRREKVVRSLIILIHLYNHYFTERLDMGAFIMSNITKFNNLNIENLNTLIKRAGSEYAEANFDNLRRDSLKVQIQYDVKSQQYDEYDMKHNSSSKGKGEILMTETAHLDRKQFSKNFSEIKDWLKSHFSKLRDIDIERIEKNPHLAFNMEEHSLYKVLNMLSTGQKTLVDGYNGVSSYIQRYDNYLQADKESNLKAKTNQQSDENSTDYYALNVLQVSFLKSYLHNFEPTTRYPYRSKEIKKDLILHILSKSSVADVLKFCEENGLDNSIDATNYLEKIIAHKKLGIESNLNVTRDEVEQVTRDDEIEQQEDNKQDDEETKTMNDLGDQYQLNEPETKANLETTTPVADNKNENEAPKSPEKKQKQLRKRKSSGK